MPYDNLSWQSTLRWRHNGRDSVANHQLHDCLLNRLFRRRSKKTSKLRVTGLCAGNSPGTGEFPVQMANNAENVSIWWRHHVNKNINHWVHWLISRENHILTSELWVNFGSGNHNNQYWLIVIWALRNKFWSGKKKSINGHWHHKNLI